MEAALRMSVTDVYVIQQVEFSDHTSWSSPMEAVRPHKTKHHKQQTLRKNV